MESLHLLTWYPVAPYLSSCTHNTDSPSSWQHPRTSFIFFTAHWECLHVPDIIMIIMKFKQNMLPRWRAGLVPWLLQWFHTLPWQNRTRHLSNPQRSSVQSSQEPAPSLLGSVCTWDAKRKHWDTLGTDPYSIHSINYTMKFHRETHSC